MGESGDVEKKMQLEEEVFKHIRNECTSTYLPAPEDLLKSSAYGFAYGNVSALLSHWRSPIKVGLTAAWHSGRIGALRTPLFSCLENSIAVYRGGHASLLGFALASIVAYFPFRNARGISTLRGYNAFNFGVIMTQLEKKRKEAREGSSVKH